ncbi:MAG: glutathione S-transferase C-terminal domain-containing protein [Pseudomonadota bacterium]
MGRLTEGVWTTEEGPPGISADGAWSREPSRARGWIAAPDVPPGAASLAAPTPDSAPDGSAVLPPEPGRYRLYAAPNCPWAHRLTLARAVLGLGDALPVTLCEPRRSDQGWLLAEGADPVFGARALHEVYAAAHPGFTGRVTTPVLVDQQTRRLVSNDSGDLLTMIGDAFGGARLRPPALRPRIASWNEALHRDLNNGVYRAGFAESQEAYEISALVVFATLDRVEAQLGGHRWLCGDALTEADIRLFPTIARFDVAYHYAFKLNQARIADDYPAIWAWAREIAQMPGVDETLTFDIWRRGYHSKSDKRNPLGIVPIGPRRPDWTAPHGRA